MPQLFENLGFKGIHPVAGPKQLPYLLFYERADLFAGNEFIMADIIKKEGFDYRETEKVLTLSEQGAYFLGISRGTPEDIVRRLKAAFDRIKQQGLLERLKNKYISG